MGAALANKLVRENSLEKVLDHYLLPLALNESFNLVNGHLEELVNIHLDIGINGGAIDVLESHAELLWIEILSLGLHQATEDHLKLLDHIFLVRHLPVFGILDFQDGFSESRDHEKLLHDRVHIADGTDVLETDKAGQRTLLLFN